MKDYRNPDVKAAVALCLFLGAVALVAGGILEIFKEDENARQNKPSAPSYPIDYPTSESGS
jgi:hypothetical protein